MFEGYKVYKLWHKKEGRYLAHLYNSISNHRITMSWAKYTMSLYLGRVPDRNAETVDHINDDKTDDRIENLQLLSIGKNIRKSINTGITEVTLICPFCKCEFIREKRRTHLTNGGNPTCCSRSCAAILQHLKSRNK